MGWFGSQEKAPDAASRSDRQKCWDSRDAYFACLDTANVIKPGDEGKACDASKGKYEKDCARSWIEYFNKRRVLAVQQQGVLTQANNQLNAAKKS
ncbi:COX6B domain-containing protein [Phanerochaete sordida]|uniref:COX6B domain-containing protein n=1 Tax=Phanerochaete sordida TaxID=48140 RepID=A0A9P3L944_9APHY|nr:COX6B domain-containing protein [Phanerochaete sordida]